jgi:capsule biosynthesis phosphatase
MDSFVLEGKERHGSFCILKVNMKRIVVDLDGTLCSQEISENYHLAKVRKKMKKFLFLATRRGDYIVIYTARGMNSCNGNQAEAENRYRMITEQWLYKNDVCYDELIFGKPAGDIYIDDKGINVDDFARVLDILD